MGLIAELKRRNVFRVAATYAVVGWILVEVSSVVMPTFDAPEWVMKVFTFLVLLGFPLAVIFAWAFEMTPEGIVLDKKAKKKKKTAGSHGIRLLDYVLIAGVVIVGGYVLYKNFMPGDGGGPAPAEASVAVLPFENLSANPDDEFFSDGITEDIITHLSKIPGLAVISRTTMMRYKESEKSIKEIGQELNVASILEGSVRRAGDRVRITGQLIDVNTDQHLWAEKYDRDLSDIFALQDEVAMAIAGALRVQLTDEVGERLQEVPTKNLAAYELYLKGRELSYRYEAESTRQAIVLFKKAIELDPEYALAWAGLSMAQVRLRSSESDRELRQDSWSAARRALELDPDLPESHFAMGFWYERDNNFRLMERHMLKTLEGNSNHAHAHDSLADIYMTQGRIEDALEEFDLALAANPYLIPALGNSVVALLKLGRYRDARDALAIALERYPDQYGLLEALLAEWVGDFEAEREALLAIDDGEPNPGYLTGVGASFAREGKTEEARESLKQLDGLLNTDDEGQRAGARQGASYLRSRLAAADGDMEKAVEHLNDCRDLGYDFGWGLAAPRCVFLYEITLGLMYLGLGDYANAVHWLEQDNSLSARDFDFGWWALKHYWLARAWEGLGETGKAHRSYATFLEMWDTADDDLSQIVDARERLVALTAP